MTPELEQKLIQAIGKSWHSEYGEPEDEVSYEDIEDLYEQTFHDNGGWDEWVSTEEPVTIPELGLLEVVEVDQYLDSQWIVIRAGDKLFKKTGCVSSYGSEYSEWDEGWTEVKAVVRPKTFYEGV